MSSTDSIEGDNDGKSVSCGSKAQNWRRYFVEAYKAYLHDLDATDIASIGKARDRFVTLFAGQDVHRCDTGYLLFRSFCQRVAVQAMERLTKEHWSAGGEEYFSKLEEPAFVRLLEQNGLEAVGELGGFTFEETPEFMAETFSKYVSPSVRAYLEIRKQELGERFQTDGGLCISLERVGERVIAWDRYLAEYRKTPLKADAQHYYEAYLGTLLSGLDNSLVFRRVDKPSRENQFNMVDTSTSEQYVMPTETREVLKNYFRKHPHSKSGKIVAEYYRIAEKNGFRLTAEVEEFVRAKGIKWASEGVDFLR
ncbi:MAG: hypothetical protein HZB26_06185 [Candidatus Hydrogenedentes bacterium]|nr:hypothetical protein [Candidatus Hydrogenedentota bacterium]